MLIYANYNVDLIDIAKGKCEMSTGFIDDCTFVAIGDTLTDTHCILKDMMEWPGGGLAGGHIQPYNPAQPPPQYPFFRKCPTICFMAIFALPKTP